MKITCDIIRDLLPLYAEDLVSEDSKQLVEEHLQDCEPCTRQLGILKKAAVLPMDVETKSIKRVGDTIRRKRVLAVLTALGVLGTLIFGTALLLDARIYLTADQAVEKVVAADDGMINVFWKDGVTGFGSMGEVDIVTDGDDLGTLNDNPVKRNYGIIAFTRLGNLLSEPTRRTYDQLPDELKSLVSEETYGSSGYQLPGGASNYNFWYVNPRNDTGKALLLDAGNPYNGEPLTDVNYHTAYYVGIMAGLCIVFLLASRFLKKPWMKELSARLAIAGGSLSLSTVIVTAGQFMELWGEFTEAVVSGACLAVPMALTCLCARQLFLLNRKEKGL